MVHSPAGEGNRTPFVALPRLSLSLSPSLRLPIAPTSSGQGGQPSELEETAVHRQELPVLPNKAAKHRKGKELVPRLNSNTASPGEHVLRTRETACFGSAPCIIF